MKTLKYVWYVARHKAFVFYAGLKTGAPVWNLIIHDWSKLLPSEFCAYRDYFQGDRSEAVHAAWLKAWELHWRRNPHHWNYYARKCEHCSTPEWVRPMPSHYVREMVADWMGAGRAITGRWEAKEWYEANKHKITLHDDTRQFVERLLENCSIAVG